MGLSSYLVHKMLLCEVVDEAMEAVGVVSSEGGSRNRYSASMEAIRDALHESVCLK